MSQLLPCPFCGEAKININACSATGVPRYWQAECEECGATSHGSFHVDREGAIKEWNTRISRNAIIEECFEAARDTYLRVQKEFVLIGPGGIAMNICNAIRALKT